VVCPRTSAASSPVVEEALAAMGVCVWPMVDLEADDGLATGAAVACEDDAVEQVIIHTPDKDLAQCVVGDRVVQRDWRRGVTLDEAGVVERFGVGPPSVPDWLALVGDSSDGFPGLKGWGRATASAVLARYRHLEAIPALGHRWEVNVSGASALAASLRQNWDLALLFRDLATLRVDRSLLASVDELRWRGPRPGFQEVCDRLKATGIAQRAHALSLRST
jgi:5'-3' exonuclease